MSIIYNKKLFRESTNNNRFTLDAHNNISFRYPNDSQIFKNSDSQNRANLEKPSYPKSIYDKPNLYKENSNRLTENEFKIVNILIVLLKMKESVIIWIVSLKTREGSEKIRIAILKTKESVTT